MYWELSSQLTFIFFRGVGSTTNQEYFLEYVQMSWANQDVATFRWPGPSLDPVTIAGSSRCKSIESGIELGYLRWYSRYSPKVFSLSHLGHLFGPYFMGSQRFQPEISCLRPVFDALNLCLWADCNGTLEGHGCALWSVWKSGRSRRSVFYGMVWLKGLPFANLPYFFLPGRVAA